LTRDGQANKEVHGSTSGGLLEEIMSSD